MTVTAEQAKALLDAATPGGWHWIRNTVDGRSTVGWSVGDDASGADIFDCLDSETDIPITSEGNARLIAAAPDLAATVIELSERIDKALALHPQTMEHWDDIHQHWTSDCRRCGQPWPCPTVQALTQGGEPK